MVDDAYSAKSSSKPVPPAGASIDVILVAGGSGTRAGGEIPKQYQRLLGYPLICYSLYAFLAVSVVRRVYVVLSPGDREFDLCVLPYLSYSAVERGDGFLSQSSSRLQILRVGGGSRAQTVQNALVTMVAGEQDWVLVHDAARPCITPAQIQSFISALYDEPIGGLLAEPVSATVKQVDKEGWVQGTIPRESLWLAQTPQMFRYQALRLAYHLATTHGIAVTDDAQAMEEAGHLVRVCSGETRNIKVTWQSDFAKAEYYLNDYLKEYPSWLPPLPLTSLLA